MESCCVLCLVSENDAVDQIKVNSIKWQTENVKYIIEKYLWRIDINSSGFLCVGCWDLLRSFHKFYLRVKEAHRILASRSEKKYVDENKSSIDFKQEYVESNIETEILIEQPPSKDNVTENENPLTKAEYDETILDDVPLKQRRKRGRPSKHILRDLEESCTDPLEKKDKSKPFVKNKKSKEISIVCKHKANEQVNGEFSNDPNVTQDNSEHLGSDTDYEDYDGKPPSENYKKKRKNPDEKTRKEHDKIISEYFKIYCSFCQTPMQNFIALRKHFRDEHKKRGFVICCKKKIFTRPILVDHIRFHLDPNFFKCKQCDKVYSDRCTLESHVKLHEDGQQDRNHICDTCGKSFVGSTQLETHKVTHAPDYEKQFSCGECGKFFTTLYSLNYHIQAIHHNKYVKICDICGKTIRCRNSFKLHMEKHENKLPTTVHCDICGLRLSDRRGLRRHKNSQHPIGGKKEYSCHVCSKISPNLRALRTHIRFAHETGYIHKCTMCDRAFKRPEALKEHMATHTGTPLYTCPWCPKTFISNGNMHTHRKKTHPKEWENAQREKYGGIFPSNYKPSLISNADLSKTL